MDTYEYRDGKFQFTGTTMVPEIPRPGGPNKVAFFAVTEKKAMENAICIKFELPCDGVHYEDSMKKLKEIANNFYVISAAIVKPWHEQVMTVTGIINHGTAIRMTEKKGTENVRL